MAAVGAGWGRVGGEDGLGVYIVGGGSLIRLGYAMRWDGWAGGVVFWGVGVGGGEVESG